MEKHPLSQDRLTEAEWLIKLGEQVRALRIRKNISQIILSKRAGIGLAALKNLEAGHGATLTTFIQTLRALERADWLQTLAPQITISPLQFLKHKKQPSRASPKAKGSELV
jgi:transcriptional regulator with XRE-family HTH domain